MTSKQALWDGEGEGSGVSAPPDDRETVKPANEPLGSHFQGKNEMAKNKKIVKMRNLINSTDRLFAALQRVDQKVDDFINAKAETLEALETNIDEYTAPDGDDQPVN